MLSEYPTTWTKLDFLFMFRFVLLLAGWLLLLPPPTLLLLLISSSSFSVFHFHRHSFMNYVSVYTAV